MYQYLHNLYRTDVIMYRRSTSLQSPWPYMRAYVCGACTLLPFYHESSPSIYILIIYTFLNEIDFIHWSMRKKKYSLERTIKMGDMIWIKLCVTISSSRRTASEYIRAKLFLSAFTIDFFSFRLLYNNNRRCCIRNTIEGRIYEPSILLYAIYFVMLSVFWFMSHTHPSPTALHMLHSPGSHRRGKSRSKFWYFPSWKWI